MQKTIQYSFIFLNLIALIPIVMGDAFDETVTEIQGLETTLNSDLTSIEQELIELRENHPLNAPKDTFESDADYQKRLSELDAIVAEHRTASLSPIADIRSQISLLYRRVFLTNDIIGTLGTYDANDEFFPITFETVGRRIEVRLYVKKADAKVLHDNWEQVPVIGWISIDPGYRRGLARVKIEYPPLWKDGVTWELDDVYSLGNNKLAVAFSPNGQYLATGDYDWQAIIWKVGTGQSIWRQKHDGDVWAVAFSSDSKYLATGNGNYGWANRGNRAAIWEVRNGTLYQQMAADLVVNDVAFSPDGRYLAIARGSGGSIWGNTLVWKISSNTVVQQVDNLSVKTVAFSPDSKYLATGNIDGEASIWEVSSGRHLQQMEHRWDVNAITFSRDGQYITTGDEDGKVSIWEVSSGQRLRQMEHRGDIYAVAYSPDGEYLAVGGADQTITFYRIGTEEITLETEIRKEKSIYTGSEVRDLAWSPHGNLISDGNSVYRVLLNPEIYESESETVIEPTQASVTFTAPSIVTVGERFTAALTLEQAQYIAGISLTLHFDPAVLEVKDVQEGDFLLGDEMAAPFFQVEKIDNAQGVLSGVKVIRKVGKATGGVLLKVVFEAKSAGVSTIEVRNVTLGNAAGQSISVEAMAGKVEITSANVDPDVNGDGKVNILDMVLVSRSFGPAEDAPDMDINEDGKIDILDLILVATKIGK